MASLHLKQVSRSCTPGLLTGLCRPDNFGVINMSQTQRPEFFELQNGSKANLPFSDNEYETRLGKLRALMAYSNVDAMLLTSMHNIAYYSGFLYCSFGRPYACVVTAERCVTLLARGKGHSRRRPQCRHRGRSHDAGLAPAVDRFAR
jgi:hypothetical protein